MDTVIKVENVSKMYASGSQALKNVSLDIRRGEIFGLLGPNGAGKTTLIGIICGLVNKTGGEVTVMGKDIVKDYRFTRNVIGLVPQEITIDMFEKVYDSVAYQRGFFGLPRNDKLIEELLKSLSLWDKRNETAKNLSGGMKRRLLIAKALVHEPKILFLDEPTAGVDAQLRQDLWKFVSGLKKKGSTIILTTHYIEEAELMADRIGVINNGEIKLVDDKNTLIKKLGGKEITLHLANPISGIPENLRSYKLELLEDKKSIRCYYPPEHLAFEKLMDDFRKSGMKICDVDTKITSLEEIFIRLINDR